MGVDFCSSFRIPHSAFRIHHARVVPLRWGLTFDPNSAIVALWTYADDHRPPHFHIAAPDFQVLVRISDLTVIAGEAHETQIAEALAWARTHQAMLALKWAELNERG